MGTCAVCQEESVGSFDQPLHGRAASSRSQVGASCAPSHPAAASAALQANPHKRLRQLYGPRMMAQYRGVPLGELSPHVYAIAEQVARPGDFACHK